jgi:NIPSNAP
MLYEVRTYRCKPHTVNEVVKRFGEAYESRKKLSEMAAFFYTEIGPLNQVIHIWPYKDLNERARIRAESVKNPAWPPKIAEFIDEQVSEIFVPFSFTPEIKPGNYGPIFEWRSYTLTIGAAAKVQENWGAAIPERSKRSPILIGMTTDLGPLNKFVHIWPYKSLDERAKIRAQAAKDGIWPPKGGAGTLVAQENKICLAAPFSPVQ